MEWKPLELWHAAGLQAETRKCSELYAKLKEEGNHAGLQELRASIQDRIDALEAFGVNHADDERAIIFEKQRMKLRKLLHETPAPSGAVGKGRTRSRRVREDSRLSMEELRAWLMNGGAKNMRGLSDELVVAVYAELSKGQPDGKLSPRDFRSWYLSFGRNGATPDNLFPTMRRAPKAKTKKLPTIKGPLYDWEKSAEERRLSGSGGTGELEEEEEPMGLPGNVLEFQIVLTEAEYKAVLMKRRTKQAELKYKKRVAAAQAARDAKAAKEEALRARASATSTGPYVDPGTMQSTMYRSTSTDKWMTDSGFER
ncbi:unnamed protein product [Symbiodinium sp. KB8]|nr:unnamed protein product [Symbiodinium sp. KB8]